MIELFRIAWFEDLLREELQLNSGSLMPLDCPDVLWVHMLPSKVIF